jgi:hypothetical protein
VLENYVPPNRSLVFTYYVYEGCIIFGPLSKPLVRLRLPPGLPSRQSSTQTDGPPDDNYEEFGDEKKGTCKNSFFSFLQNHHNFIRRAEDEGFPRGVKSERIFRRSQHREFFA